jgi:tRNA(fMet)-specific endonuclease VapC
VIADSDVLIDALKGIEPALSRIRHAIEQDDLETTTVSVFEVLAGARDEDERAAVSNLLEDALVFPLDIRAAAQAAEVDRLLRREGLRLATGDTLIAGIALSHGQSLLTRNRRHFDRIPGLEIQEI